MRAFASILALCFVLPLFNLSAQQTSPVRVGSRLRVTVTAGNPNRVTGDYLGVRENTLELEVDNALVLIPVGAVERLEVSRSLTSYVAQGALIGSLAGSTLGLMLSTGGSGARGCAVGALVGLLAGAGVAAMAGLDVWDSISIYHLDRTLNTTPGRSLGISAAVMF
jgi:hypothetical protein